MSADRRRNDRLDQAEGIFSPRSGILKGRNISLGGICLLMEKELHRGEVIDVTFHLPVTSAEFLARAKVIWQEPSKEGYLTGFEFVEIHVKG
jgi:hypothetical protein